MAYTKAGQKAVDKYIAKAYDQFPIRFKKGERDKYKEHAESKGKSLNALIIELLENDMNGHQSETQSAGADTLEVSAEVPTVPEREECENTLRNEEKESDILFNCSKCRNEYWIDVIDFENQNINFCPGCGRRIKT